ncbi:MAG: hypothetical protein M3R24_13790 [Chloroflexota bacterium]|nr:hypothetical protein [Chloroflexota bacterium]
MGRGRNTGIIGTIVLIIVVVVVLRLLGISERILAVARNQQQTERHSARQKNESYASPVSIHVGPSCAV